MNKHLIKSKKRVKFLWALTAIPVLVAGTIAASCAPVTNNSQGESGNDTTPEQKPEKPESENPESEKPESEGEKPPVKPDQKPEINENQVKFDALREEFVKQLVVNKNASSMAGSKVTVKNIGQFIDMLKDMDTETGILTYKDARVHVWNIQTHSDTTTKIKVDIIFDAYGITKQSSHNFSGFIQEQDYLMKELMKYADSWNYKISEYTVVKFSEMYSTQIYTKEEFLKYFKLPARNDKYEIRFEGLQWPSTSSLEAVFWIGLKGWNSIPPVKKVLRYDGFNQAHAALPSLIFSEYEFNDPIVFTKELDWKDWRAKVIDWNSPRSQDNMKKALLEAANKVAKKAAMELLLKQHMLKHYGLNGVKDYDGTDTWKVEVQLPQNWLERVKQLTNWDKEFYDEGRTALGGISDWAHPQARLKRSGWHPEFKLVASSKKVPNFKLEHKFWLVGTERY